jgi:hypothetical protein
MSLNRIYSLIQKIYKGLVNVEILVLVLIVNGFKVTELFVNATSDALILSAKLKFELDVTGLGVVKVKVVVGIFIKLVTSTN